MNSESTLEVVGPLGLEPRAFAVSGQRSNQLSYGPKSMQRMSQNKTETAKNPRQMQNTLPCQGSGSPLGLTRNPQVVDISSANSRQTKDRMRWLRQIETAPGGDAA